MSEREFEVRRMAEAWQRASNTLAASEAIAAFVDSVVAARIREAMVAHVNSAMHVTAPVQPEATAAKTWHHHAQCAKSANVFHACNMPAECMHHNPPAAAKSEHRWSCTDCGTGYSEWPHHCPEALACSCREIQAADPSRHFKGCARRVEKADAPYRGEIRSMGLAREWLQHHWPMEPPNALVWSLAEVIAAERAWRSAKELEAKAACDPPAAKPPEPSKPTAAKCPGCMKVERHPGEGYECASHPKPAAVGLEPPERVTLFASEDGEDVYIRKPSFIPNTKPVDYVLASAYEKAIEALRALVASLPKCTFCPNVATRAYSRGEARYCDAHTDVLSAREYPRAQPLRNAIALLAAHDAAAGQT